MLTEVIRQTLERAGPAASVIFRRLLIRKRFVCHGRLGRVSCRGELDRHECLAAVAVGSVNAAKTASGEAEITRLTCMLASFRFWLVISAVVSRTPPGYHRRLERRARPAGMPRMRPNPVSTRQGGRWPSYSPSRTL